eukprot:9483479-Ditylum_brightwellii.AAC.1
MALVGVEKSPLEVLLPLELAAAPVWGNACSKVAAAAMYTGCIAAGAGVCIQIAWQMASASPNCGIGMPYGMSQILSASTSAAVLGIKHFMHRQCSRLGPIVHPSVP